MRFTALTLSAMANAVNSNTTPVLTCSEDIVRNAESQGFVSSIYNCVISGGPLEPQRCLTQFIADNETDNPFPITGTCRDAYQSFVGNWAYKKNSVAPYLNLCDETFLDDGAIPASKACIDQLDVGASGIITVFHEATGFYAFRMCSSARVRAAANDGAFETILHDEWYPSLPAEWVGDSSACEYCYDMIKDAFLSQRL